MSAAALNIVGVYMHLLSICVHLLLWRDEVERYCTNAYETDPKHI